MPVGDALWRKINVNVEIESTLDNKYSYECKLKTKYRPTLQQDYISKILLLSYNCWNSSYSD
jgi:hypothetical protein